MMDFRHMNAKGNTHGSIAIRFWRKVNKGPVNECWEWIGGLDHRGYGKMGEGPAGGKTLAVHRVSYELHFGPIPEGQLVCHRCDNRRCVNPAHFFLGTQKDNMQDCKNKDRHHAKSRHYKSKITTEISQRVLELRKAGMSHEKISKEIGTCRQSVSNILSGNHWTLEEIADKPVWRSDHLPPPVNASTTAR